MNSPEDIRRYRQEQQDAIIAFLYYVYMGTIPVLLGLILWRVW